MSSRLPTVQQGHSGPFCRDGDFARQPFDANYSKASMLNAATPSWRLNCESFSCDRVQAAHGRTSGTKSANRNQNNLFASFRKPRKKGRDVVRDKAAPLSRRAVARSTSEPKPAVTSMVDEPSANGQPAFDEAIRLCGTRKWEAVAGPAEVA
jgi:hypothetical protein